MSEIFTNIELDELAYIENIDARAYNICKYNDLDDLEKILQYFFENGNFTFTKPRSIFSLLFNQ